MNQKIALLSMLCFMLITWQTVAVAKSDTFEKATSSNVHIVGRHAIGTDGSVSFDWVGTYLETDYTGGSISVKIAVDGKAYFNVMVDGRVVKKILVEGSTPQTVVLDGRLGSGRHTLRLQQCTEGEYGKTTVYGFTCEPGRQFFPPRKRQRLIEFYGDSYTCGFGVESNRAEDPFKLETENCNDAYGCLIANYFDADYVLIAHSGQGIVRDYGDKKDESAINMFTRHDKIFDAHDTVCYAFQQYQPDLVVINLGTNDFSPNNMPRVERFIGNYKALIHSVRSHYGAVPVFCVTPHSANIYLSAAIEALRTSLASDTLTHFAQSMTDLIHYGVDLGASWHPNRLGQRKIAMSLIPQVASLMGWNLMSLGSQAPARQQDWAQIGKYRDDNLKLKSIHDSQRVVFLGNSITEFWQVRHSSYFTAHPHYINRGISGQTSYQMLTRFREDVLALKPKAVVISAGTNDIAENTGHFEPEETFGNIVSMTQLAQLTGIKVILTSVLPTKKFGWRNIDNVVEKISDLNKRIKQYATKYNLAYVDYYHALVNEKDFSLKSELTVDGVHPNAQGYQVMEEILEHYLK